MSKYTLLGKEIVFSKAEDNYYELQAFFTKKIEGLYETYNGWYEMQQGASNVINNIESYFKHNVEELILKPLYPTLAKDYSIFGVSQSEYYGYCLNISKLDDILEDAIEVYNNIKECRDAEIAEREEEEEWRKAGQISFGIGDSLKNAASNAAHSVAKSSGNATSREEANERWRKLYNDMRDPFWDALVDSLNISLTNHMHFVNAKKPNSINADYDKERSEAYLDNATNIPEKRASLLVEAFKACPWNEAVYTYIFKNYPDERKNLIEISKHYGINLSEEITAVFKALYTKEAKGSEQLAIEAKSKIKAIMKDWGISHNVVIDEIENDCLARMIEGLNSANKSRCNDLKSKIKNYDALESNKKSFLKNIDDRIDEIEKEELTIITIGIETANEIQCNKMKEEILKIDALEKNKEMFFKKIELRIKQIWAKEDGEVFDNYLMNANILSSCEINEGIKFVQDKGRTDDAKKYLTAFQTCKERKNVQKARLYQSIGQAIYVVKYIGYAFIAIGILLLLYIGFSEELTEDASFSISWSGVIAIAVGIGYNVLLGNLKKIWEAITVNGKVINPALTMNNEEFNKLSITATSIDVKAYTNNASKNNSADVE